MNLIGAGLFTVSACAGTTADLLLTNGLIHLDADTTTTLLAVAAGRVIATGDTALAAVDSHTRIADLNGGVAWPGFIDTHAHYLGGSFIALGVSLNTSPPLADMNAVKAAVNDWMGGPTDFGPGTWIFGFGWNSATITSPDGRVLDDISRPIVLIDGGGHTVIANSEAMRRGGIDDTTTVAGGEIVRDPQGHATGWLKENATGLVLRPAMQQTPDVIFGAAIPRLAAILSGVGVTGIGDVMGMPGMPIHGREEVYKALERENKLPLRVHYYVPVYSPEDAATTWSRYVAPSNSTTLVRFAGGKIWVDGGCDTGGADTSFPHVHLPTRYFDLPALRAIVGVAEQLGIPVQFHVNGDLALEDVIMALEEARTAAGGRLQPHTLVHLAFATPTQLQRIKTLGVSVSAQPIFWGPIGFATELAEYGNAATNIYNYEAVSAAGIPMGIGTDWPAVDDPMSDFVPLKGLAMATTSYLRTNDPRLLTAEQFLRGYTQGSAGNVNRTDLGNLHTNACADLVVFDKDPLRFPGTGYMPSVLQTWVNGSLVTPLAISARLGAGAITLIWPGGGTLQVSDQAQGHYTSFTNAVSPYTITDLDRHQQYYRVLQ